MKGSGSLWSCLSGKLYDKALPQQECMPYSSFNNIWLLQPKPKPYNCYNPKTKS